MSLYVILSNLFLTAGQRVRDRQGMGDSDITFRRGTPWGLIKWGGAGNKWM